MADKAASLRSLDTVRSLLRWRLRDPAWEPRFVPLLDDVRLCVAVDVSMDMMMSLLRDVAMTDPALADRVRLVAEDASRQISRPRLPPVSRALSRARAAQPLRLRERVRAVLRRLGR